MDAARALRDFWFGPLPLSQPQLESRMQFWFADSGSAELAMRDAAIRERFAALLERAAVGELDSWADGPRRRLSLIVLFDQFPRNIFRGTARAFAFDARALQLALSGMQSGADAALDPVERIFFYMPLQHAESADVQDESIAAFRRLVDEAPQPLRAQFEEILKYAEMHRAFVQRFGRFPHRNRLLGRLSTAQEQAYLQSDTAKFGQ